MNILNCAIFVTTTIDYRSVTSGKHENDINAVLPV